MKSPISNFYKSSDQGNHIGKGCNYIEGIPSGGYCTVDFFVKVPIIFEGIPGGDIFSDGNEEKHDCTDDIFERGACIIEGISGGVNHSEEQGVKR